MIREIDGKNYLQVKVSRQQSGGSIRLIKIETTAGAPEAGRISLLARQDLIANNMRFLAGETKAVITFAVTGKYPLILVHPAILPPTANPVIVQGYAVVVLAKGKTVQEGVPIPAANAGGMLLRKEEHLDTLFQQDLFLCVGSNEDTVSIETSDTDMIFRRLTDDWCEIEGETFSLTPCVGIPNGSVVAPRLEFLAMCNVYLMPAFGKKFLQDFFAKKFSEDNSIYFYFVERDGNPVAFARCDKEGTLLPCSPEEAPSGSVGYEPDESRPSGISDVVRGLAEIIASRLG